MSLVWRTYRDPAQAPVPIVRARTVTQLRVKPTGAAPDTNVAVQGFERAVGLLSGVEIGRGSALLQSRLAYEPVLLHFAEKDDYGMRRKLARPLEKAPLYDTPQVLYDAAEPAILVPGAAFGGPKETVLFRAEPRGRGCFSIPRGFVELYKVLVGGRRLTGRFDYDAYHGTFYMEYEDGTPVHEDTPVEVWISLAKTDRLTLADLEDGTYMVTRDGLDAPAEPAGRLIIKTDHRWTDARRLPNISIDADARVHRVDHTQFDGTAIAASHLFIIKTDAPLERVEHAARRTLPAGSIYRIERLTVGETTDEPIGSLMARQSNDSEVVFSWTF